MRNPSENDVPNSTKKARLYRGFEHFCNKKIRAYKKCFFELLHNIFLHDTLEEKL
jgi:hypothetical protein